jgi:hypothetical protein
MRFRVENAVESADGTSRVADPGARLQRDFAAALADDLNVSKALAALFAFVKEANVAVEGGLAEGDRERISGALTDVDRVLGVLDPAAWRAGTGRRGRRGDRAHWSAAARRPGPAGLGRGRPPARRARRPRDRGRGHPPGPRWKRKAKLAR